MKIRSLFSGLALAVGLAAPVSAEINDSVNVKITEFDLPNGLHVILSEDHTVPRAAVDIYYKVGSANESRGRTGFAHLFEHLMFCGSGHVPKGQFDKLTGEAGAFFNAATSFDRTEYYIDLPSRNLPLALYLESDRMGYLRENMRPNIVDEQRDVVKNELRQRYLNSPDSMIYLEIPSIVYPDAHPYSWPVIGSMEDLTAASYGDVTDFYEKHYAPGNASLAIVGDFDTDSVKKMVEYWFSDVPPGRIPPQLSSAETPELPGVIKKTFNYKVNAPRRRIMWHSPAAFQDGSAACQVLAKILCGSIYSRLTRRLTHDAQLASEIHANIEEKNLTSVFYIDYKARPEHTLDEIQTIVDEEIARISQEPPAQKEVDLAVNGMMQDVYDRLESNLNVASTLNRYYCTVGEADYFNQDLERYRRVTPQDVSACAKRFLLPDKRVEISILPEVRKAPQNAPEMKTAAKADLKTDTKTVKESKK